MAYEDIYGAIMDWSPLSEAHAIELTTKRGFSQDTILKFRFGTCGSELAKHESELLKHTEQDLIGSGVFILDDNTKKPRLNPILLEPRILIPYLSTTGRVYHIRPHKMGLTGVPVEVYQESNLSNCPREVILTEGEFKAVAGMQYGVPTIAITGIASFSEAHFPRLVALLNQYKVQKVIVLFDNEVKDDPKFPGRYKDNPSDRHDTEFYAYYMASRLERESKEVLIANLPDSWRVNGKIDIDGAAAQLKTKGEILRVMHQAKPRNEYLHNLSTEARQIVLRKSTQKHHRSRVKREFNRYVVTRKRGKTEWEETISNFVIRIVATHDTRDGMKREVEFVNEFGNRSHSFTMDAAEMAGSESFRTFCLSRGDFIWTGTLEDLMSIWGSEFLMMDEGRYIIESDHVGWQEAERLWLFGNVAIAQDSRELRPDKNGIFWLEKKGIKAVPLSVTTGKNTIAEGIPALSIAQFDTREVLGRMADTIGRNEACVMLGWISSVLFMEEIFDLYNSFPFLFLTGRWQSGKSTVAEWVMSFFGLENAGRSISQTTNVAIQRSLAYYSSLPVFLDEFRNTKEVAAKGGFLRNVYNRQSSGKGMREDFGLREAKVRGTLVIAGEETPKDGALLTRCIPIFISKHKRTQNHFNWFTRNRIKFSFLTYDILSRKKDLVEKFIKMIEEWKESFTKAGLDDRMAINYATVVAGYATAFGEDDLEFANWLAQETKQVQVEQNDEQAVSVFLDDLVAMKTRKLVDEAYWHVANGKIYLYFHGLHNIWAQEFRKSRGEEAFKEGSIRSYLKEEPGFLEPSVPMRIGGVLKKCVVFDLERAPVEIKSLVDMVFVTE